MKDEISNKECYELIYELVNKYIDVDCFYLTSTQRRMVLEYLDSIEK